MPSVTAFRHGFNFVDPIEISAQRDDEAVKYSLVHPPTIEHVVIRQNREYEFPTTMQFSRSASKSSTSANHGEKQLVLEAIKRRLIGDGQKKIIYSEYGSPYECFYDAKSFKVVDDDNQVNVVVITCKGVGNRTFDIPTEAERRNHMIKTGTQDEAEDLKERLQRAKSQSYRVVKSHFNTGKCAECQQQIHIGEQILQKRTGRGGEKGGWAHLDCLFPPKSSHKRKRNNDDDDHDDDDKVGNSADVEKEKKTKTTKRSKATDSNKIEENSARKKKEASATARDERRARRAASKEE